MDFLVNTVKLKPIIKDQIPGKLVTSVISDVATASVHSEKTWAKKWIMIIGERARHSQVCSIENRGYIYNILYIIGRAKRAPHLGVQSRFRVIYICRYVCRGPKSVGGITWAKRAHAQSQYWAVKSDQ